MAEQQSRTDHTDLFGDRNFVRFLSGGILSMLGDQFTLIALPWLVLIMTKDPFDLGIVGALIGVPRGIFILIGGAAVDRYSPKRVLLLTKYFNAVLLILLAALALSRNINIWMVYGWALAIGLTTAFSIPSGISIMPQVVADKHLPVANSVMLGLRQVIFFIGPILAGMLIAFSGSENSDLDGVLFGLGLAFLFDAVTYLVSAWTLSRVPVAEGKPTSESKRVMQEVFAGLRHCWNDLGLRLCFLYWAAIMLLIAGPIQIAIPILALHLGQSAAGFGVLVGAHGAGILLGMIISSVKSRSRISLGLTILAIDGTVGVMFILLGQVNSVWQGTLLMLAIGSLTGFFQIRVSTWMQVRVPRAMLGRVMSIFMFILIGITPLSSLMTGWLMRSASTEKMFTGGGLLLIGIVLITLLGTSMRNISDAPRIEGSVDAPTK